MHKNRYAPQAQSCLGTYPLHVLCTALSFKGSGPRRRLGHVVPSEDYKIKALKEEDVEQLIIPRLTLQNSIAVLKHDGLSRQPAIQASVCEFVGENFLTMMQTMEDQLMTIPKSALTAVLQSACKHMTTDQDTQKLVGYCLQKTELESACDLLRETKTWNWGGDAVSMMRAPPNEEPAEGSQWVITNVRAAMEHTPARVVVGRFFDWKIRLDYGAEGKLRIVYESATPQGEGSTGARCIDRFPSAQFAWRVIYQKKDVFNEKAVFICFPTNVQLHWSTTLPVDADKLGEDEELIIMVNMAENPILSLILYYFSADLKNTVFNEDILNRLPHIEYRCLSSYSLVKAHNLEDGNK